MCVHTAVNAVCDNGLVCDGIETCNAQLGCVSTPPNQLQRREVLPPSIIARSRTAPASTRRTTAPAATGQLCNGARSAIHRRAIHKRAAKPGTPFVCPSDGIACTGDVCDPVTNQCVYVPNNNLCPCTQTCNVQQGGCGNFCNVRDLPGQGLPVRRLPRQRRRLQGRLRRRAVPRPLRQHEDTFYGGIPGQNNSPCKSDCYFDADTGSRQRRLLLEPQVRPARGPAGLPPEGNKCSYDPNANTLAPNHSCSQLYTMQSASA